MSLHYILYVIDYNSIPHNRDCYNIRTISIVYVYLHIRFTSKMNKNYMCAFTVI